MLSLAEGTGLNLLEYCCWIQQTDNCLKTVRSVSGRLSKEGVSIAQQDREGPKPKKSNVCIRTIVSVNI